MAIHRDRFVAAPSAMTRLGDDMISICSRATLRRAQTPLRGVQHGRGHCQSHLGSAKFDLGTVSAIPSNPVGSHLGSDNLALAPVNSSSVLHNPPWSATAPPGLVAFPPSMRVSSTFEPVNPAFARRKRTLESVRRALAPLNLPQPGEKHPLACIRSPRTRFRPPARQAPANHAQSASAFPHSRLFA